MESILYLLALPLLALPWLIKLIFPQKPQRLRFSQMYLLSLVLKRRPPLKKSQQLLLNLVRAATLLALILSLAGVLGPDPNLDPDASQVLVFDDSFYARSQGSFERQRELASDLLNDMSAQQEVSLLGRSGRLSPWMAASQAKAELKRWNASFRDESWLKVTAQLARLQRQRRGTHMEIHWLGDALSAYPKEAAQAMTRLPSQARWVTHLEPQNADAPNWQLFASTWSEGQELVLSGKVSPNLPSYQLSFTSTTGTTLTRDFQGPFTWKVPALSGRLSLLAEDAIELDQHLYVHATASTGKNLSLWSPKEAAQRLQDSTYYLEKGLLEVSEQQNWNFKRAFAKDWHGRLHGHNDTFILHNPLGLSTEDLSQLQRLVQKGGKLMIFVGPQTPIDLLDGMDERPADLLSFGNSRFNVKWPKGWTKSCPSFSQQEFLGGYLFKNLHPKADVLATRTDGSPFWIRRRLPEGGEIQLCSSPYHISWSKSPLHSDFLDSITQFLTHEQNLTPIPRLEVGFAAKGIQSLKNLMGNSSSDELSPGIVDITLDNGRTEQHALNFPRSWVRQRQAIELPKDNPSSGGASTDLSPRGERLDPWLALLMSMLLILEALVLFDIQRAQKTA